MAPLNPSTVDRESTTYIGSKTLGKGSHADAVAPTFCRLDGELIFMEAARKMQGLAGMDQDGVVVERGCHDTLKLGGDQRYLSFRVENVAEKCDLTNTSSAVTQSGRVGSPQNGAKEN